MESVLWLKVSTGMKSSDFVADRAYLLLSKQTVLLSDSERLATFFLFNNFLRIENKLTSFTPART